MNWEAHGATDVGRQRSRNEDGYLVSLERALFAVADGMGGHVAGDVASRTAIETIDRLIGAPPASGQSPQRRVEEFIRAARAANDAILEDVARAPERAGMGTTLTVFGFLPEDESHLIVHIGDSRAYLLRDGTLSQLTTDHTWVQRQVELGKLTPRRARVHPYSSVLTHALGVPADERIDTYSGTILENDLYLLCTDGLTAVLEDEAIESVLKGVDDLEACAQELIDAANQGGGPDNITVVLVRFSGLSGNGA